MIKTGFVWHQVIEAMQQGGPQGQVAMTFCHKLSASFVDFAEHGGERYDVRIQAYAVKVEGMDLVLARACDINPILRWR